MSDKALFVGTFPTGISYADKRRERFGDYAKIAFASFGTMKLDVHTDCPADLHDEVVEHFKSMAWKRGDSFQVSTSGQTIMLGHALSGVQ